MIGACQGFVVNSNVFNNRFFVTTSLENLLLMPQHNRTLILQIPTFLVTVYIKPVFNEYFLFNSVR